MTWKVPNIKYLLNLFSNFIKRFCLDDHEQLTAENTDDSNHEGGHKLGAPLREQDRFLPIANVAKIMKRAIPETGKVNSKVRIAFIALDYCIA